MFTENVECVFTFYVPCKLNFAACMKCQVDVESRDIHIGLVGTIQFNWKKRLTLLFTKLCLSQLWDGNSKIALTAPIFISTGLLGGGRSLSVNVVNPGHVSTKLPKKDETVSTTSASAI